MHTDLLIANIKNLITEICQLLSGNPVTLYKTHKVVCFDPAHIDRFQERLLYLVAEAIRDYGRPSLIPSSFIGRLETLDIKKYDRVFGSVPTVIQEFLYHINKAAAVIGSRQIVSVLLLMCGDRYSRYDGLRCLSHKEV